MLNKINFTFGQRAELHCNQELENKNTINCFPVTEKGTNPKFFCGRRNQASVLFQNYSVGFRDTVTNAIFEGKFPEGRNQEECSCPSAAC